MRQYRGKVLAALWKDRHVTVKAVLTVLALAPLTAWTGHGPPVPAVHSETRGVTGVIVSAVGGKCLTISPSSPRQDAPRGGSHRRRRMSLRQRTALDASCG